jgi:hypothetical protein
MIIILLAFSCELAIKEVFEDCIKRIADMVFGQIKLLR